MRTIGVEVADKITQMNNNNYMLMDASAVEYKQADGSSISVQQALENSIDKLTKEGVEGLLGLTKEEIEAMADLILDTEVRIDKTYSSSKIYSAIQDAIDSSKNFTLNEIGKMSGASYKVVTSTTEMTDEKIIYLLENGATYDMYIVEKAGTVTKIGDTAIDLSSYLKTTDAESAYLKKTDATTAYVAQTSFNNHITDTVAHLTQLEKNKLLTTDNITSTINNSSDNTQVPSAKATYDLANTKANTNHTHNTSDIKGLSILENRITTNETNITDLQEQTSDLQKQIDSLDIPEDVTGINNKLAELEKKRVYNSIGELNNAKGTNISLVVGEDNTMKIVDALSPIETFTDYFGNSINSNRFGIDANTYGTEISLLTITKFNDNVVIIRAYMSNGKLLVRRYQNGVLQGWSYDKGNSKDVAKTTLTPVFPNGVAVASGGVCINYIVRNGWCNVDFVFNISSAISFSWTDIATGLPKPANSVNIVLMNDGGKISRTIPIKINSTGSVSSRVPTEISATDWWSGNISYPVAE